MKHILSCITILLLLGATANAQTKQTKASNKKQTVHSKPVSTNNSASKKISNTSATTTLSTTTSYPAKTNAANLSVLNNSYTVTDPILTTLNARANGANIQFNKSGIVGMPKRAYGFANGHLLLNSTGAVTSGTQTGSGAVGTGTSMGTFGSIGAPMNVNGKSPYAGINMWGNAMNMEILKKDSFVRLTPLKKQ